MRLSQAPVLLAGLGNPWRRDDGVGPWVVRALATLRLEGVACSARISDGLALIDVWRGRERVYLFDALRGAGPAGALRRFDAIEDALPADSRLSSHALALADAVSLGRTLGCLPRQLTLLGIEGADFGHGEGLSGPVRATAERLVTVMRAEIGGGGSAR